MLININNFLSFLPKELIHIPTETMTQQMIELNDDANIIDRITLIYIPSYNMFPYIVLLNNSGK